MPSFPLSGFTRYATPSGGFRRDFLPAPQRKTRYWGERKGMNRSLEFLDGAKGLKFLGRSLCKSPWHSLLKFWVNLSSWLVSDSQALAERPSWHETMSWNPRWESRNLTCTYLKISIHWFSHSTAPSCWVSGEFPNFETHSHWNRMVCCCLKGTSSLDTSELHKMKS